MARQIDDLHEIESIMNGWWDGVETKYKRVKELLELRAKDPQPTYLDSSLLYEGMTVDQGHDVGDTSIRIMEKALYSLKHIPFIELLLTHTKENNDIDPSDIEAVYSQRNLLLKDTLFPQYKANLDHCEKVVDAVRLLQKLPDYADHYEVPLYRTVGSKEHRYPCSDKIYVELANVMKNTVQKTPIAMLEKDVAPYHEIWRNFQKPFVKDMVLHSPDMLSHLHDQDDMGYRPIDMINELGDDEMRSYVQDKTLEHQWLEFHQLFG